MTLGYPLKHSLPDHMQTDISPGVGAQNATWDQNPTSTKEDRRLVELVECIDPPGFVYILFSLPPPPFNFLRHPIISSQNLSHHQFSAVTM